MPLKTRRRGPVSERPKRGCSARREARRGERAGEVPIGAVLVLEGAIIGTGFKRPIGARDPRPTPTILALRGALDDSRTSYGGFDPLSHVEPCRHVRGALMQARVAEVVSAPRDPSSGRSRPCSMPTWCQGTTVSSVRSGVLAGRLPSLVQRFFGRLRSIPSTP